MGARPEMPEALQETVPRATTDPAEARVGQAAARVAALQVAAAAPAAARLLLQAGLRPRWFSVPIA